MPRRLSNPTPGGVLWDLDGTLIDSSELHYEAWAEVMRELGRPLDRAVFAQSFGSRNDRILRELLQVSGSDAEIRSLSERKEQLYRDHVRTRGAALLPGAAGWLGRLKLAGWRQALATSAPRENIDATLEPLGLRQHFDVIVSADDVGRGKPDPLVFLTAARQLGLPPARCVVVEDAPAGLEGARRAGMASIGVLSAHHASLDADLVVASLDAIAPGAFEALVASASG
jgi:beta-phosphoglucomutase